MTTDVLAACNAVFSDHQYEKFTLVGKSLGTIAMGSLLADHRFQQAACIWFTPLLTVDWLRLRIEQIHPPSLFIIGTADPYYQPSILEQLEKTTNSQAVLLKDVNHALEIDGDIQKSILLLSQITQSVQKFLNESI